VSRFTYRGSQRLAKKLMWQVRLGQAEWARFTYARPAGDSLRLLGSARRGMQMGALAVTTDGQYVHVVGDHIADLPMILIKKAISRAEAFEKSNGVPHWPVQRPSPAVAAAPVVVIKRRRVAVPA
jgi:hypothetical protein